MKTSLSSAVWAVVATLGVTAALFAWPESASADVLGDLAGELSSALTGDSLFLALAVVFAAGLLTALTPCVYPMIAITVSIFGARQAKSKLEGAMLSGSFVLGIAAFFTPMGVISAMTGAAMGQALASPWVSAALAFLFIAMAVSMFGAWDMNLPPALQNRLAKVGGSGYKGAFGVGFVNGLIAAPCTGPVLSVLLTYVGTTQSVAFGGAALFVYSLGLGTLFFFVGTFAVSLPKSGKWLDYIKSIFGVIMLVLAIFYIKAFLPRPAIRTDIWWMGGGALLVFGVVIGAIHLSFKEGTMIERIRKGVGVAAATLGAIAIIFWGQALPEGAHIEWQTDYVAAETEARETGRPLLVDFGASWCGACNELEHETLSDPRVVAEAARFVTVRIDMSVPNDEYSALLSDRYHQPGLPLIVIHDVAGEEQHRVTGLVTPEVFLEMLESTH